MQSDNLESILIEWNERQQKNILAEFHSKGLGASGRFEKELTGETTTDEWSGHTEITAPIYARWLQDGRKRTSPTGPYILGPTLQHIILKWIDDKGIIPDFPMTKLSLSWAISQKIHREGYPQKIDFYSVIETKSLNEALKNSYIKEIKTKLWQSLESR